MAKPKTVSDDEMERVKAAGAAQAKEEQGKAIISARDHLRAALDDLEPLRGMNGGSDELDMTRTKTTEALMWLQGHGHDGWWRK